MSTIQDTDLLLVNRGGVDYKITAENLKEQLEPKPWEGHDGGIFHIKDVTSPGKLPQGPHTAWDVDGTNERPVDSFNVGDEFVFVTDPKVMYLFAGSRPGNSLNETAQWKFGEHTDVSKMTGLPGAFYYAKQFNDDISGWDVSNMSDMIYMFYGATSFNQDIGNWDVSNATHMGRMFVRNQQFDQDISGWDTSNVVDMDGMFEDSTAFNQDLSNWCVTNITSKPTYFDTGTTAWTKPKPCWGHCPPKGDPCSPPMPWDNYVGGKWHVKNASETVNLTTSGYFPGDFLAWDIDGTNERKIGSFGPGDELVFATPTNVDFLFIGNRTATWEFGTETDTSIATSMQNMFYDSSAFNQDLSNWCVTNITSKPNGFDTNATAWTLPKPVWGTCPNGEDQ